MSEEEVIKQIESLIDDRNSFIDSTDKSEDNIFRKDKEALQTALQLLEQKDNKINKVIDKLKLFKNDLKEYDKKYENRKDVPSGVIGIRINELLKILEE